MTTDSGKSSDRVESTTDSGWWSDRLGQDPAVRRLLDLVAEGGEVSARGAAGSSTSVLAAAIAGRAPGPVLLVVPHLDDAEETVEELRDLGVDAVGFPALEVMPGEREPAVELVAARLGMVRRAIEARLPALVVAPFPALMQGVPEAGDLADRLRVIREGDTIDPAALAAWLGDAEWTRTDVVENPGEFAIRGGLIDLFPPGGAMPVRLDLFGDEVERLHEIDPRSQASDRRIDSIELVGSTEGLLGGGSISLASFLPRTTTVVLAELGEIVEQGRGYWERVRDAGGVTGPPATLAALRESSRCLLDINEFSASQVQDRVVSLAPAPLPPFPEEVGKAFDELLELAGEQEVALACSTTGEYERAKEILDRRRVRGGSPSRPRRS